jgi:hypothetical protein
MVTVDWATIIIFTKCSGLVGNASGNILVAKLERVSWLCRLLACLLVPVIQVSKEGNQNMLGVLNVE